MSPPVLFESRQGYAYKRSHTVQGRKFLDSLLLAFRNLDTHLVSPCVFLAWSCHIYILLSILVIVINYTTMLLTCQGVCAILSDRLAHFFRPIRGRPVFAPALLAGLLVASHLLAVFAK